MLFTRNKSIFFVTFHKAASTLFSWKILPQAKGLRAENIARRFYQGEIRTLPPIQEKGMVYGPIRLTSDKGPEYKELLHPILARDLLLKYPVVFFARDPRDILVSFFYSITISHNRSPEPGIARLQEEEKREALELGIDDWVLERSEWLNDKFLHMHYLHLLNKNSVLITYEDMIYNFPLFKKQILRVIKLEPAAIREAYDESRPRRQEDATAHKRSGRPYGFYDHLKSGTVDEMNRRLRSSLELMGFEAKRKEYMNMDIPY